MRTALLTAVLCVAVPALAAAQSIARGKYIVEQVGMCQDCHTPRDQAGKLIAEKRFAGAPVGFRPMHPMPFAEHAPALAGIPAHYTQAQFAAFLQTGKRPDGSMPLPPMPPYRLSRDDAWSVVEYLKTVK